MSYLIKIFRLVSSSVSSKQQLCFVHCHIVADTNVSPFARARTQILCQKMFLILFRNILCPQQMFPSLRSPRNIMGNNASATTCPCLPGPLVPRLVVNNYCVLCRVKAKKENKNIQQNHSPLFTMIPKESVALCMQQFQHPREVPSCRLSLLPYLEYSVSPGRYNVVLR